MYPCAGTYVPMSSNIPFFGESLVRRRILGLFFVHPGKRAHVRQVARELGTVASVVGRELRKLEEAGVLKSEAVGRARVYRLNEESGIARDARALFQKTEGIEALLRQALVGVPGIERALLFGSYADRTERPDSDLDVLVVGTPSQSALSEALMPLEDLLGRSIHTTSMSAEEFDRRRQRPGFLSSVMDRPRIDLLGLEA
jgi:predicted nucleotidyltransferase